MSRFINSSHATSPPQFSVPEWGAEYQALPRYRVPVTASMRVNPTRSSGVDLPRPPTVAQPARALGSQAVPRTAASIALRRAIEHREQSPATVRSPQFSVPEWGAEYQALPRYRVPVTASMSGFIGNSQASRSPISSGVDLPRPPTVAQPARAVGSQAVPRTAASVALRRAIEHREQSPATVTMNPARLSWANHDRFQPSNRTRLTTSAPSGTWINPALFAQTYAPRPPSFLTAAPRATAPPEPSQTLVFINVRPAISPPVATATAAILPRWAAEGSRPCPTTGQPPAASATAARATSSSRVFRRSHWAAFASERGAAHFYTLLSKLKEHHQYHPQDQVVARLKALYQTMCNNPTVRAALLNEAQIGAESCSDLAVATLNQLEIRCAIEQSIQGRALNDQTMLTIMRGVFRQEQLYAIAEHKVSQQQAARLKSDPVETHLFYTLALRERLQLPGNTRHMTFTRLAGVTDQEAQRAGDKVLCLEKVNPQGLINFIQANEHWQRYLQQHYQSQHDHDPSIAHYGTLMEQLDAAAEAQEINGNEYLHRCNQLMQRRQTASTAWYRAKTLELIERYLGGSWRSNRLVAHR